MKMMVRIELNIKIDLDISRLGSWTLRLIKRAFKTALALVIAKLLLHLLGIESSYVLHALLLIVSRFFSLPTNLSLLSQQGA